MAGSSSFYNTSNPSVTGLPTVSQELTEATQALNENLAAYTVVNLGYAPSVTVDWSQGNTQRITLSGAVSFTFTGGRDGEKLILDVKQDANGNWGATWPANVRFGSLVPTIALTSTALKTDKIGFIYNATDGKYDVVAVAYGF